jgi:hypothetical protein
VHGPARAGTRAGLAGRALGAALLGVGFGFLVRSTQETSREEIESLTREQLLEQARAEDLTLREAVWAGVVLFGLAFSFVEVVGWLVARVVRAAGPPPPRRTTLLPPLSDDDSYAR